ncbi:MAG: PKD domain-containing protein [Bacteroidetes bacterium]|nr:PKD domain-containing protein [Bacteroidota bacterium]
MHYMQPVKTFVCLFILVLAIPGCKKANNNNKSTSNYDFSWSAEPIEGVPITFYSTAPQTKNHVWDFGTGITSTAFQPQFVYGSKGTYTVTLTIDNDYQNKITKQIVVGDNFGIGITGGPCPGDTFYTFVSAYPAAKTYKWDFGDGDTSSLPNPYHIYAAAGTYNAKLTINNYHIANTTVTVYKDPVYTNKVTGNRLWHIQQRKYAYNIDTTIFLPDVNFEVKYIDKVTVFYDFNNYTGYLKYNESMTKGNVLAYGDLRNVLYYDHVQDTIRIIKIEGPDKNMPYEVTTTARTP